MSIQTGSRHRFSRTHRRRLKPDCNWPEVSPHWVKATCKTVAWRSICHRETRREGFADGFAGGSNGVHRRSRVDDGTSHSRVIDQLMNAVHGPGRDYSAVYTVATDDAVARLVQPIFCPPLGWERRLDDQIDSHHNGQDRSRAVLLGLRKPARNTVVWW